MINFTNISGRIKLQEHFYQGGNMKVVFLMMSIISLNSVAGDLNCKQDTVGTKKTLSMKEFVKGQFLVESHTFSSTDEVLTSTKFLGFKKKMSEEDLMFSLYGEDEYVLISDTGEVVTMVVASDIIPNGGHSRLPCYPGRIFAPGCQLSTVSTFKKITIIGEEINFTIGMCKSENI